METVRRPPEPAREQPFETSSEGWKLVSSIVFPPCIDLSKLPLRDGNPRIGLGGRASRCSFETSLEGWKHPEQRDERIVALLPKLP